MRSKKEILALLKQQQRVYCKTPSRRKTEEQFRQICARNWAVEEIIRRIEKTDRMSPMMVVERFIKEMNDCACLTRKNSRLFSAAEDEGCWILDILLSSNERRS